MLGKIGLLLVIFFVNSCSSFRTHNQIEQTKKWYESITVQEKMNKPGEVIYFRFRLPKNLKGNLICDNRKMIWSFQGDYWETYVPESYFSNMKTKHCIYKEDSLEVKLATITIKEKTFPAEKLKVDKKRVFLNKKDAKRVEKEREYLKKQYALGNTRAYFSRPFSLPIDSFVTSIYGSKRIFNNKKQTQHLGTDYRAAIGVPIKTANAGKVIVADDLFYTGNTVVIDHGLGIFTIYGHLSKLKVDVGDIVPVGEIIGLAGATGRVTGPHLHWGIKVNEFAIEGDSLIKASQP